MSTQVMVHQAVSVLTYAMLDQYTAMLRSSIGIGTGYTVSLEANIIGYWILGALLGIVLTPLMYYCSLFL